MFKAIIFDFFGVFCPDITFKWFKKNIPNYETKLDGLQKICTKSDYGILSKHDFYHELSLFTGVAVQRIVSGVEAEITINQELVAFAKDLKNRGYLIACLSNGTHEWTLEVINSHGLQGMFNEIVLSGDVGVVKPDRNIYEKILEILAVKPQEALFIDDRLKNIEAANELGMKGILFTDNSRLFSDLKMVL